MEAKREQQWRATWRSERESRGAGARWSLARPFKTWVIVLGDNKIVRVEVITRYGRFQMRPVTRLPSICWFLDFPPKSGAIFLPPSLSYSNQVNSPQFCPLILAVTTSLSHRAPWCYVLPNDCSPSSFRGRERATDLGESRLVCHLLTQSQLKLLLRNIPRTGLVAPGCANA